MNVWYVNINNTQRDYCVTAVTCSDACEAAGRAWRTDTTLSARQQQRGIYHIDAQKAKFGQIMQVPADRCLRADREYDVHIIEEDE